MKRVLNCGGDVASIQMQFTPKQHNYILESFRKSVNVFPNTHCQENIQP